MALKNEVLGILQDLSDEGWRDMILDVTSQQLDLGQLTLENMEDELTKRLDINRTNSGFEDFYNDAEQAITPGFPAKSLLFHALASPAVVSDSISTYPSANDLEVIENYIYSTANVSLQQLLNEHGEELVICTMASEYRVGPRTVNRKFADMIYSRTGIGRVGNSTEEYSDERRSYILSSDIKNVNVIPVKFGAYIGIRTQSNSKGILNLQVGDRGANPRSFTWPIHKLFAGDECFTDVKLTNLTFEENHIQEKLAKLFEIPSQLNGVNLPSGFNIDEPPFKTNSGNSQLVSLNKSNGNLTVRTIAKPLVELAVQNSRICHFNVPPAEDSGNRFFSSYLMPSPRNLRIAPEYANIRHEVVDASDLKNGLKDLNKSLNHNQFDLDVLERGGYDAALFTDSCCEGYIRAILDVDGSRSALDSIPAYSIQATPDYFPYVDQLQIDDWIRSQGTSLGVIYGDPRLGEGQGGTRPLSFERTRINPSITSLDGERVFDDFDTTLVALVSHWNSDEPVDQDPESSFRDYEFSINSLTDGASGIYAPGWDISNVSKLIEVNGRLMLDRAALGVFGLGSPFPEDAKLCAALNSFWPAAAPDASRTFNNGAIVKPLLDVELGYHRRHKKVLDGTVQESWGWDGEQGPFFEQDSGQEYVNYTNILRSDYISNILEDRNQINDMVNLTSTDLINRIEFLRKCFRLMGRRHGNRSLLLVSAEKIKNWSMMDMIFRENLSEPGFYFEFAFMGSEEQDPTDISRLRRRVESKVVFATDSTKIVHIRSNADVDIHRYDDIVFS